MEMSRNGFAKRVKHQAVEEGGRWHGDDNIFPNIDMCLITLVGRFSQSPTNKKNRPVVLGSNHGTPLHERVLVNDDILTVFQ